MATGQRSTLQNCRLSVSAIRRYSRSTLLVLVLGFDRDCSTTRETRSLPCTFQAVAGARFDRAGIVLELGSPEWARFADVAPREVRDSEPVKIGVDRSGKVPFSAATVEANFEASRSEEFTVYRCLVTGPGEGTRLARWEFSESPDRREGLPIEQRLLVTLAGQGRVSGGVSVSARLVRPGIAGAVDRVRELVFGGVERIRPIAFEFP